MNAWPALIVALFVVPLAAAQQTAIIPEPNELPPCDVPAPVKFAETGVRLENLEFGEDGVLYLTALTDGLYQAFPDGTVEFIAESDRPPAATDDFIHETNAFMGVTLADDGALYVSEGYGILRPVDARVLRFPVPGDSEFEVFATGFDSANGLASDEEDHLYLAHGFSDELWQIREDGSYDVWTSVPDVVNGVVEDPEDDNLVIGPIGDPSGTVMSIPLDAPDERNVLFRFNSGPSLNGPSGPTLDMPHMTKGIDDLTITEDGRIIISAHLRLQFIMGDPSTGQACVLLDGTGAEPSSVRIADDFGEWDGWAFTTDFSGDVWAIDVTGDGDEDTASTGPVSPWPGLGLAGFVLLGLTRGPLRRV